MRKVCGHVLFREIVADRFLRLPIVQKYEVCEKMRDGFIANIELDDGYEFALIVYVMQEAYPAQVMEKIRNISNDKGKYPVIAAPYISIYLDCMQLKGRGEELAGESAT